MKQIQRIYKPKIKNLFINNLLFLLIFGIFFIIAIFNGNIELLLILAGIFFIIESIIIVVEVFTYNEVFFFNNHLEINKGFLKKTKVVIRYEDILQIRDNVYFRFHWLDYILIKYGRKSNQKQIRLNHSFFTNDIFREIHTNFFKFVSSNKIIFVKGYYDVGSKVYN